MKHTLLYIGMLLASFMMQPAAVQAKAPKQAKAQKEAKVVKQLVVLHTNDTHSCVMPINPNLADTAMANRGGYLRRVAMIKQERKANPDLLLFDSGDFSQGSPYYSLFKGDVEVGLMNEMKYDAATIGNHEFDLGPDKLAEIDERTIKNGFMSESDKQERLKAVTELSSLLDRMPQKQFGNYLEEIDKLRNSVSVESSA